MLVVDKDGWVIGNLIIIKEHRGAIEYGSITGVKAVVLHRTSGTTAATTLSAWKTRKYGTHFLISENGKIFQTASLKKQCQHVGKLYSKCRSLSSCSEEEAKLIENILRRKNTRWGKNSD